MAFHVGSIEFGGTALKDFLKNDSCEGDILTFVEGMDEKIGRLVFFSFQKINPHAGVDKNHGMRFFREEFKLPDQSTFPLNERMFF
jgi:hypothetical protein